MCILDDQHQPQTPIDTMSQSKYGGEFSTRSRDYPSDGRTHLNSEKCSSRYRITSSSSTVGYTDQHTMQPAFTMILF
jgi:beta-glucanase (GH16 family)